LKLSPLAQPEGGILHALNVKRDVIGGFKKRSGYTTLLSAIDNGQINSLWSWQQNDGGVFLYRSSGSILYHSIAGTGAWTISGNGTITSGSQVHHGVTADTMLVSQHGGTTRHTTNGTGFTDTTGAPTEALGFEEYQGRIWALGTASNAFFSEVGTPTTWTATDDLNVPGAGRLNSIFKASDRLIFGKTSGKMFRYDGFSLVDLSTNLSPSSPFSTGEVEGYKLYLTRQGYYGYGGGFPEIISNPLERLVYNSLGSGIPGARFDDAPGIVYKYDYLNSIVGTITDNLIGETYANPTFKYDYQLDEWSVWKFNNHPTALGTYEDAGGNEQLIWGDLNGQAYQFSGTATSDNGAAIPSGLVGFIHGGSLEEKDWKYIRGLFNPGCRAMISFAISDTFTPRTLNWKDIGDAVDGVVEYRFPSGTRGIFLFWKIYESSRDQPWEFYGFEVEVELVSH